VGEPVRGALLSGLTCVVALLIAFGRETIAVLELLSGQPHPPTRQLANLMNDVGAQIAHVQNENG
jgi:hypothetical protein